MSIAEPILNRKEDGGNFESISESAEKLDAVIEAIKPPTILLSKNPEEIISPSQAHPAWSIEFFMDRAEENAQFGVVCDRACNPASICTLPGPNSGILGHLASNPAVAVFLSERQLPGLMRCAVSVESADDKPIKNHWDDAPCNQGCAGGCYEPGAASALHCEWRRIGVVLKKLMYVEGPEALERFGKTMTTVFRAPKTVVTKKGAKKAARKRRKASKG